MGFTSSSNNGQASWKCFHQEKVIKATGSLLAVLSLALQLQPLVMDCFGGGGSAVAQKEIECPITSSAFKTDLSCM